MKIITLTLNPAFDVHCHADELILYRENLVEITSRNAGGKGVNISRALAAGEIKSRALVVLGDENGDSFLRSLYECGLDVLRIDVKGRIRENITIHGSGGETRISFSGFSADEGLLLRVLSELEKEAADDSIITFTGRVPDGIEGTAVKDFLLHLKSLGARLVIDSKSVSLADILEIKPWLIKPNREEISQYLGREIFSFDEVKKSAEELHREGIENVMVSLGEKGAMLVSREGTFIAAPKEISPLSTIGAGDSTVAGFMAAYCLGKTAEECLKMAVAYGTAACLTEGTLPPRGEDIPAVLSEIKLERI